MKLLEAMPEDDSHNVAVFRLEQLAPFPFRELKTAFDAYPNAQRVVWVQEEPGNMGALRFVAPFLARALPESIVLSNPIARPVSAAPATGNPVDHQKSHQNILLSIKDWIQKRSD
jgi:2-oxoglutarate dehydrogenase E1 component